MSNDAMDKLVTDGVAEVLVDLDIDLSSATENEASTTAVLMLMKAAFVRGMITGGKQVHEEFMDKLLHAGVGANENSDSRQS